MSQTPELLPCPWCHEKPSLTSGYSQQGATVECVQEKCPLNPGAYVNARPGENSSLLIDEARQEAIRKWNTRAQPAVDDAVEAAERIISLAVANCKGFDPSNKYPKVMTDIDTIRTALAQSTQSPGEQPPQTVSGDLPNKYNYNFNTPRFTFKQSDDDSDELEISEHWTDKNGRKLKRFVCNICWTDEELFRAALTRHEGA